MKHCSIYFKKWYLKGQKCLATSILILLLKTKIYFFKNFWFISFQLHSNKPQNIGCYRTNLLGKTCFG